VSREFQRQVVISGHAEAVKRASVLAKERGAKRVMPLKVNAAFHTELMVPAAQGMDAVLNDKTMAWAQPSPPVVSNVYARPYPDAASIPIGLVKQITSPVRWAESVKYMQEQGIDLFIEPGPGKVLCDLIKRISPKAKALPMRNAEDLEVIIEETENG